MKKIMFKDSVGLTKAVLDGRKTQTRRVATYEELPDPFDGWLTEGKNAGKRAIGSGEEIKAISHYALNEVVAIAQSYEDTVDEYDNKLMYASVARIRKLYSRCPGWCNKMFVQSDEMPHRIKITNIRVEKLKNISTLDCLREGIIYTGHGYRYEHKKRYPLSTTFYNPFEAFRSLIYVLDRKMWNANPYVWVYDFELVE